MDKCKMDFARQVDANMTEYEKGICVEERWKTLKKNISIQAQEVIGQQKVI